MKKILFWLLLPLTTCVYILFGCLAGVSSAIMEGCHLLERWCFGTPEGMKYIGDGWYISRDERK